MTTKKVQAPTPAPVPAPAPALIIGSANDYERVVAQKAAEKIANIVPVLMPSGFVWGLQPLDIQGWVLIGKFPQSLLDIFITVAQERGMLNLEEKKKNGELSEKEIRETMEQLEFLRKVVLAVAASPKIVEEVTGPNQVHYTKVDPDDFKYIFQWALNHKGVAGIASLQKFQSRRQRRASKSRSNGSKLRAASVGAN
jgi:hypothetical protein